MTTQHIPEPIAVVQAVERYIDHEAEAIGKYQNRAAFDEDGAYLLHRLVADMYAQGHADGERVARERMLSQQYRERQQRQAANAAAADKAAGE